MEHRNLTSALPPTIPHAKLRAEGIQASYECACKAANGQCTTDCNQREEHGAWNVTWTDALGLLLLQRLLLGSAPLKEVQGGLDVGYDHHIMGRIASRTYILSQLQGGPGSNWQEVPQDGACSKLGHTALHMCGPRLARQGSSSPLRAASCFACMEVSKARASGVCDRTVWPACCAGLAACAAPLPR